MNVGFFLVVRDDVQHFLHAASLVRDVARRMPGTAVVQLTDATTPAVPGVTDVIRDQKANDRPLLDVRLAHYATCDGEWLLADTDVSIRNDVRGVFDVRGFDVALCDRNWPHSPQGEAMLQAMPFNTGVVFSRTRWFWRDVLDRWRSYSADVRANWMSEQLAVYDVVRTGAYRVKVLPGILYNYPPRSAADAPVTAAMLHYKGDRKAWLSDYAQRSLGVA